MPGYRNVHTLYGRLGYTFNAVGNIVHPQHSELDISTPLPPIEKSKRALAREKAIKEDELNDMRAVKAEGHSRLWLQDSWLESLQAMNGKFNKSYSAPNVNALFGGGCGADDERGSTVSAASDASYARAAGSRISASHLSASQFSRAAPSWQSSWAPKHEKAKSTWTWEPNTGPRLLPPGVTPSSLRPRAPL